MCRRVPFTPAALWRAFFFAAVLAGSARAAAPGSGMPDLAQAGKPGPEEAARILEQFRRAGVAGEFFFEFEFRTLPRLGAERTIKGHLWGGRVDGLTAFRLEFADAGGEARRLLIRNGERGGIWRVADGRVVEVDLAGAFEPLVPGVEVSAFDLQMPFLHWPDATLEKITRVFGRPSYAYQFRAPPEIAERTQGVAAARAFLDTQFNALMQTELLGPGGRAVKTFSLISLKKVGDQYIPKQADYRNEATRDKTRFQVTGAALRLQLPASTFQPAGLTIRLEPPAPDLIVRIEP